MLAISMHLNYLYNFSIGQTPEKAEIFARASVVADIWKGLGPVFIYALLRNRKPWPALAGALVWVACFAWGVSSALGLVAQDRMAITGGRETLHASYADTRKELDEKEAKRKSIQARRSSAEVEAAIAVVLARPISRGTVGQITASCAKPDRSIEACGEVAFLRQELAGAVEAQRLDQRIADLRHQVSQLRDRGATSATDPQAEFLSWLSVGTFSSKDIGFGLILLVGAVIEVVSAFGLGVVVAYADATRAPLVTHAVSTMNAASTLAPSRNGRTIVVDSTAVGTVMEYLTRRTELAAANVGVELTDLFADYTSWCRERAFSAMTLTEFRSEFDLLCQRPEISGKILAADDRYYGIRLISNQVVRLPARKKIKG